MAKTGLWFEIWLDWHDGSEKRFWPQEEDLKFPTKAKADKYVKDLCKYAEELYEEMK